MAKDGRNRKRRPGERRASVVRPLHNRRSGDDRREGQRRESALPTIEDRRCGEERRIEEQRKVEDRRAGGDRRLIPERVNRVAAILLPRVLSPRDPKHAEDLIENSPLDFQHPATRETLARQLRKTS